MLKKQHSVGLMAPQKITVRSIITDTVTNKSWWADEIFPISYATWKECYEKWLTGATVQDAFPMLNAHQREHLLTANKFEEVFSSGDA